MSRQHKNQGRARPFFNEMVKLETDDCIVWQYGKSWNGYGQIDIDGKTRRVHRLAADIRGIPKTEGKNIVGHTCHNRACFNYRHLKWINNKENMADKLKDGTRQTGINNGKSKLDEDKVRFIRQSSLPQRKLAKMMGVSQSTINDARLGKTWNWL